MIDIQSFDHFSFDLWMTIIKSNPQFKPKRTKLLQDFFSIDKSLEEINKTIRYYDNLYNQISEKTGNHIPREEVFYLILDALKKDITQITTPQLTDFFALADTLFLENLPEVLWKDIYVILEEIKNQGKTTNILSNTAFIHGNSLRKVLEDLGLADYFSFMIFSDEVGFSKPNIKIFEYLYQKTLEIKDIDKSKIIHIGDNSFADYNGALEYGIQGKLVKFD
ncbi:HAD family hydrolase [Empedobacter tilapiae]|uniref:Phosphoglycolate phosphatase n=1 Tax=Empedobacter tilapiae TaxID=2491114 RepID=A0A4Z1B5A4_9FLAO|nr:HAD-IA family hydrolase [Empedobacter tilapiae]TGN26086.1 phosphoglycolate phosphatase [Empedobacter tilapiae]